MQKRYINMDKDDVTKYQSISVLPLKIINLIIINFFKAVRIERIQIR